MYTYRIWDKASPINDCPSDKAITELGIKTTDEVYIIVAESGADCIVQTARNAPYPGATIEESAQNHINAIIADQTAAEETSNQPTVEDRLAAAEAAIMALIEV